MSVPFEWPWPATTCQSPSLSDYDAGDITNRQDRLKGFSSAALARAHVFLIGAGGLGGAIAGPLVRKGVGRLTICDPDVVMPSNLHRQQFYPNDLFQPKALCLAEHAAREGCLGSMIVGHQVAFDEVAAETLVTRVDVAVCGIDNNVGRIAASRHFRRKGLPLVLLACDLQALSGWVFVQEGHGPCIACVFPFMAREDVDRRPCVDAPAVVNVLHTLAGIALHAVDTLLMERPRYWNFKSVHLSSCTPDCVDTVAPRPGCPVCGGARESESR